MTFYFAGGLSWAKTARPAVFLWKGGGALWFVSEVNCWMGFSLQIYEEEL